MIELMLKLLKRFLPILIIGLIAALAVGGLTAYKFVFLKSKIPKTQEVGQVKPKTERETGNAKYTAGEGVDTPLYQESLVGKTITSEGGVIKTTLKNGTDVYLSIPKDAANGVTYAEVGEFSDLPTSSTHVPLYSDLGFGVNVAFEGPRRGLDTPAYLVFDFSNGNKLREFKNLAKKFNRCDFSSSFFHPEACAALLGIPANQTINPKYIGVSPKHAADGRTPTFAVYSYYLGTDELLAVRVDDSDIIIPQPLTTELAHDLVASSFQKYALESELYEAMDLVRNLNLEINDHQILADMRAKFDRVEFKDLYAANYLESLLERAVNEQENQGNEQVSLTYDLDEMKKINQTVIERVFEKFAKDGLGDIETYVLSGLSNLRRAYNSDIVGSSMTLVTTLKKINDNLDQNVYAENEEAAVVEGALILAGFKYSQNSSSSGSFVLAAKVLGEKTSLPSDSQSERERTEQEIRGEAQKLKEKARGKINNTLSNEYATSGELIDALKLAQLIGDADLEAKVLKKLEEAVKEETDKAEGDQQKIRTLQLCQLVGVVCQELENQVAEIERRSNLEFCYVKVGKKTLKNFADQKVDKDVCDRALGQ